MKNIWLGILQEKKANLFSKNLKETTVKQKNLRWSEDVQTIIKAKRIPSRNQQNCKSKDNLTKYKIGKNEITNAVGEAKYNAFDNLYCKLDTKEGEKVSQVTRINKVYQSEDYGCKQILENSN